MKTHMECRGTWHSAVKIQLQILEGTVHGIHNQKINVEADAG